MPPIAKTTTLDSGRRVVAYRGNHFRDVYRPGMPWEITNLESNKPIAPSPDARPIFEDENLYWVYEEEEKERAMPIKYQLKPEWAALPGVVLEDVNEPAGECVLSFDRYTVFPKPTWRRWSETKTGNFVERCYAHFDDRRVITAAAAVAATAAAFKIADVLDSTSFKIKISDQPHIEFQQSFKGAKVELVEKQQALLSEFMKVAEREIKERDAKIQQMETRIHELRTGAIAAGPALGVGYLVHALIKLGQTATREKEVELDMYDEPLKRGSMGDDFHSRRE